MMWIWLSAFPLQSPSVFLRAYGLQWWLWSSGFFFLLLLSLPLLWRDIEQTLPVWSGKLSLEPAVVVSEFTLAATCLSTVSPSNPTLSFLPVWNLWLGNFRSYFAESPYADSLHHLKLVFMGKTEGGEGGDRGWDGWMASPTQWTWIWTNSGR